MAETPQDPASLVQENAVLKAKLEDYKKLEEDLLAKRVFDKARGYLTTWITLGGIILTLAGFVGYQSVVSYFTDLAKKKADAISEKQMTEIVQTRIDIRVQTRVDQEMPRISERLYQNMIQRAQPLAVGATSPSANPSSSQSPKTSIDWTAKMPALRDQGQEGAAVGLALATTLDFYISQATGKPTSVSAREIYYEARLKGGTFPQDSGGFIKDGIDFLKRTGVVEERAWPYHGGEADQKPPASFAKEKRYKITDAKQIVTLDQLKSALDSGPVVAGVTVYEAFISEEVSKTGILPTPKPKDRTVGGHAICIIGYDDQKKLLKFQNSWGAGWGDHGFGYISYDYFREQSADCWTFRYAGTSNP